MKMLPTNVYSFMKKMVSNTDTVNVNQFVSQTNTTASTPPGAMGRLRQTLQQAQETVSNRLTASSRPPQVNIVSQQQQPTSESTLDAQRNVQTPTSENKEEITEMPRPGSAGRCRVCVKAMKPDEYSRECTECELRVCDDCASYSQTADGNEISWRCSVCRRRGVAIIARRVQPGIEQSEALEGVGFETTVRKSPDARRLAAGGRADSETEVLLLAPKASDVRRHSDVPLRDIAKFQAQAISAATSQHDLGNSLTVGGGGEKAKARSSNELMKKETDNSNVPTITKDQLLSNKSGHGGGGDSTTKSDKVSSRTKQGQVKRQRSYERGASEGTLNLPGNNRGRRASCDLRSIDPNALNLNNNTIPSSLISSGSTTPSSEKHNHHEGRHGRSGDDKQQHGSSKHHSSHHANPSSNASSSGRSSAQQQQEPSGGGSGGAKNVTSGNTEASNLGITKNDMRRRSVQITNTSSKPATAPRSCTSLDASEAPDPKKPFEPPVIKRQGSSADGEAIKIVIDDVDSNTTKDNNKGQTVTEGSSELRTKVVRLRRDPQDRGYQTRGFGIRVVGGCSSSQSPGHLRARVARVTPGSGADFAGVRRGDVVLSWNGIRLTNLTFEDTCKVMDASGDSVELTIASYDNDALISSAVPENEATSNDWEETTGPTSTEGDSLGLNPADRAESGAGCPTSPTSRRRLPRLPGEGRIQLRLFNDEIHNTLEIAVVNIAFGQEDSSTLDLNDIIITLRIGEKVATTRWNQCTLFTKVSPEDLFDSWLIMELQRGPDFLGECHVDMGRVSLDDRPVWFPFSSKGSSTHRGSISQIMNSAPGSTTPSARELARRLRMRMAAGSQSQSEEQDDSSGQSSPCASSLLRPEVAWEVLGTLGPPGVVLTCRSAPTSRRGSAQSDRVAIGTDDMQNERGSLPSTPQMPRSLPPSRRGSFAVAVEEIINRSRRSSVAFQRVPDTLGRQLPEIPDGFDPAMLRNRRNSAWNPRETGFDRRQQFERTDSLRTINPVNPPRRVSADFRDFRGDPRNQQRKSGDPDESWRQQPPSAGQQWSTRD